MLKKSQLAFYKENGYIVVKQMIPPESFIGLFSTTVNLLKNYAGNTAFALTPIPKLSLQKWTTNYLAEHH